MKILKWIGSSREDLMEFPAEVVGEMAEFIFVLHAFQKKSKSGIATPKQDIEMIKRRLKGAESLYKELKGGK